MALNQIIGIDFGTTNTVISFFKEEGVLQSYIWDQAYSPMIPSVIAYDNNSDKIIIGNSAKEKIGNENFKTYEHFKLDAGIDFDDRISLDDSKSFYEITKDFLTETIEKYKRDQHIDRIEKLVATVPEEWMRSMGNVTIADRIRNIYKEITGDSCIIDVVSEPEAACAYFIDQYNKKENKKYEGNVLVVDYGGGTLDITLCKIKDNKMVPIAREGAGNNINNSDCAGVAYCNELVKNIVNEYDFQIDNKKLNIDDVDFKILRAEVERKFVTEINLTESLIGYYENKDIMADEEVFSLRFMGNDYSVKCRHIVDSFIKVASDTLRKLLDSVLNSSYASDVDLMAQDESMKILLVGGFSNLYCVKHLVKKVFDPDDMFLNDRRFDMPYADNCISLAVSYGAALISSGLVEKVTTIQFDIGIVTYNLQENELDSEPAKVFEKIISKNSPLEDLNTPIYSSNTFKIFSDNPIVIYYIKDDDGKRETLVNLNTYVKKGDVIQVGFFVDDGKDIYLSIKQNGACSKVKIGEV